MKGRRARKGRAMKGNCVEGIKKKGDDESVNREKGKGGERMLQRGRKSIMYNNERNEVKMMRNGEASEYEEKVRDEQKLHKEGRKKKEECIILMKEK